MNQSPLILHPDDLSASCTDCCNYTVQSDIPGHIREILQLLQEQAIIQFPAFPAAFGQLSFVCSSASETVFDTDGQYMYVQPDLAEQYFLENYAYLRKCFLHIHLHCLCFHMIQSRKCSQQIWNLACDLSAGLLEELLLNRDELRNHCLNLISADHSNDICDAANVFPYNIPASQNLHLHPKTDSEKIRCISEAIDLLQKTHWLNANQIIPLLKYVPDLVRIASKCRHDSHRFWIYEPLLPGENLHDNASCHSGKASVSQSEASDEHLFEIVETLLKKWENRFPKLTAASGKNHKSNSHGSLMEDASLKQQDSMDYHKFLRRFCVPREEAILDMDSFDYIPYYYGVNGVKFIEPLEYSEVNRLDELAIAIDTSGSCSGKIVRRFLEETWSILRQKENFFSKMRLHLIQCDLMIQEHRIFTSVEEFEAYLPDLKIHGHGDTDFTPVFDHLTRLIEKREIRTLRGLLYFTDGDGIFPNTAPPFDTAFVFLNEQTEKHKIPAWAIRLNLHLPDEF